MDLAYPLTESVEIDGVEYKLDMSFDNILRLIDLIQDRELYDSTKVETGLYMLLGIELEWDLGYKSAVFKEIFEKVIAKDAEAVQEVDIEGNPMPYRKEVEEQVFSIKQDADYIYASFLQDYGIDLFEQQGKLHWYKFLSLLQGLKGDTKLGEVIGIRAMDLPTGKGTAKQRERIGKLKKVYKLKKEG